MKKALSLILCMVFMLTMLVPFSVNAADGDGSALEFDSNAYNHPSFALEEQFLRSDKNSYLSEYLGQDSFEFLGVPMCGIEKLFEDSFEALEFRSYTYILTIDTSKISVEDAFSIMYANESTLEIEGDASAKTETIHLYITPSKTYGYGTGDVNGNGELDVFDYILIKRAYFGTYTLSFEEKGRGNAIDSLASLDIIDQYDYLTIKKNYFAGINPYEGESVEDGMY